MRNGTHIAFDRSALIDVMNVMVLFIRATCPMAQVFVDKKLVFSCPVPYPRHMTELLTQCRIGTDLDGQTSGVLLFSGAADLNVVRSMLKRLAGRTGIIGGHATGYEGFAADPDLWADPATVSSQERLKRKLLGSKCRIFAALLPGRTVNGRCLEPHNGRHAQLRAGTTHAWTTRTAQDMLVSIGGAPALLPLAHHLLSDSLMLSISAPDPNPLTGQNVDTVLSILLSFLDGNVMNQVWRLTANDSIRGGGGGVATYA